jgi:23S rRNA (uracil1939-C5)-methyltransferase
MSPLPTAQVTVETLGGLGDGIASLNGRPVFIPKSCPGDRLDVRIVHENQHGLQGVITHILSPGPARQTAPCRYFERCGGCTLQQLAPPHYREFKTRMLHSALAQGGFPRPEADVLFLPPGTRRRVEFKVKQVGDRIALAFHELRSHTPIAVDECMVLKPELQSLIAPLAAALSATTFTPHPYAVSLTAADSGIDMTLTFKGGDIRSLPKMDRLCKELGLARISVRTPDTKPQTVADIAPVEMQLGAYRIALPADAFLQATAEGQSHLTKVVMEAAGNVSSVVDLFCGIGTYSFPLSHVARTHAVEMDEDMVGSVHASIKRHAVKNLSCEQRDLFKYPLTAKELERFDMAVINPPRIGAKVQTQQLAQSPVATIAMVSCNPATFARDARILKQSGFTLASVQGIDQFLWSQHLEIIAVFKR